MRGENKCLILVWDKGMESLVCLPFDLNEEGTSEVNFLTSPTSCPMCWLALLSSIRACELDFFYLKQNQRLHSQSPPDSPDMLGV